MRQGGCFFLLPFGFFLKTGSSSSSLSPREKCANLSSSALLSFSFCSHSQCCAFVGPEQMTENDMTGPRVDVHTCSRVPVNCLKVQGGFVDGCTEVYAISTTLKRGGLRGIKMEKKESDPTPV